MTPLQELLANYAERYLDERDTIEDVIEPYLIQQGFLMRTPRGRTVTRTAWKHFGLRPPESPEPGQAAQQQAKLFEDQ